MPNPFDVRFEGDDPRDLRFHASDPASAVTLTASQVEEFKRSRLRCPGAAVHRRRDQRDSRLLDDLINTVLSATVRSKPPPRQHRVALHPEQLRMLDEVEARITTAIDIGPFVERKRRALAMHASQIEESFWARLPPEAFGTLFGEEAFIRAHDTSGAPHPETDLFAGLR